MGSSTGDDRPFLKPGLVKHRFWYREASHGFSTTVPMSRRDKSSRMRQPWFHRLVCKLPSTDARKVVRQPQGLSVRLGTVFAVCCFIASFALTIGYLATCGLALASPRMTLLAAVDRQTRVLSGALGVAGSAISVEELRKKFFGWFVLFASSSALAAAETAITALYPWKVRDLAESEGRDSPFALLNKDITRFLTTILVASTICSVYSTALATDVATKLFGSAGVGYATGIMTIIFLFFGEILPKTLAVHNSDKVARLTLRPLHILSQLLYPIGRAFSALVNMALMAFGLEHASEPLVSENELRLITAGARRSGGINVFEHDMIESVLDLEETEVREIMEPRVEMTCVDGDSTIREFLALESATHYSRYPVFRDNVDNITGVLYAKKLLQFLEKSEAALDTTIVTGLADPALFVPESMTVWRVLEEMRKKRIHMAIVVDEYGGTAGLVTLEDIMEEIVGEIYDEDDYDYEQREHEIVKIEEGIWRLDGQAELEKTIETIGLRLPEEDLREYGTIGGLLCDRMGGIPNIGDQIHIAQCRFIVEGADDRRIIKVRAERLSQDEIKNVFEQTSMDESEATRSSSIEVNPLNESSIDEQTSTSWLVRGPNPELEKGVVDGADDDENDDLSSFSRPANHSSNSMQSHS